MLKAFISWVLILFPGLGPSRCLTILAIFKRTADIPLSFLPMRKAFWLIEVKNMWELPVGQDTVKKQGPDIQAETPWAQANWILRVMLGNVTQQDTGDLKKPKPQNPAVSCSIYTDPGWD